MRINGHCQCTEGRFATVAGYAGDDLIVRLTDGKISQERPYTTLVVPSECCITQKNMPIDSEEWELFQTEDTFVFATEFNGLNCQLQAHFSRKLYQNFMTALRDLNSVIQAPESVSIDMANGGMGGDYMFFELTIDLTSYPATEYDTLPWSCVKFNVRYPAWIDIEEDEWDNNEHWKVTATIIVSYFTGETERFDRNADKLVSKMKIDQTLNMYGLVEKWQELHDIAAKHSIPTIPRKKAEHQKNDGLTVALITPYF